MKLDKITHYKEDKLVSLFGLQRASLATLLLEALPVIAKRRASEQKKKLNRKRKVGGGHKVVISCPHIILQLKYTKKSGLGN